MSWWFSGGHQDANGELKTHTETDNLKKERNLGYPPPMGIRFMGLMARASCGAFTPPIWKGIATALLPHSTPTLPSGTP